MKPEEEYDIEYQIRKNWVVLMICGLAMLCCLGVLYQIGAAQQHTQTECDTNWQNYIEARCTCTEGYSWEIDANFVATGLAQADAEPAEP
jgi:hypothetical protein